MKKCFLVTDKCVWTMNKLTAGKSSTKVSVPKELTVAFKFGRRHEKSQRLQQ